MPALGCDTRFMTTTSSIGGMNVPAALGRANATVPLAELVIGDETLTLRPRKIGRLIMTDFVVGLDQVTAAFRLRGTFMTSGVGIRLHDGAEAYFWTSSKQDAVLAALNERGVPVDTEAQRAQQVWSLRGRESEATLPTFPRMLQTLTPVLAIIGTAIMIVLVILAESWWIGTIAVLLWVFSTVSTLGLWWKGRTRQTR